MVKNTTAEMDASDDLESRFDEHLSAWIDGHDAPGVSVALVDGGETAYAAGFGERDAASGASATAETLYGVGSATKPVTATAVLTLVADGAVDLDDPVADYLPAFAEAPGEPITVHDLLSHTSGLPPDDLATVLLAEGAMDVDLDAGPRVDGWEEFPAHVAETVGERRSDGAFRYYNTGYTTLSRVVEVVSGTSFPAYVRETVFDPLGMERATFDADAMTPHVVGEDGDPRPAAFADSPLLDGPGGLLASVTDLAQFLAFVAEGGSGVTTDADSILPDDLRRRAFEPVGTKDRLIDGSRRGYGYGWETRPFGDDTLVGHSGGTGVSSGYVGFLRERGVGVAVGCNAMATPSPTTLASELLALYLDCDPATVLPERAIERKATDVTGRYEAASGLRTALVEWDGDRLQVEMRSPIDNDTTAFRPASLDPDEHVFVAEDDEERRRAEFHREDDGWDLLLDWSVLHRVGDVDAERETDDGSDPDDE